MLLALIADNAACILNSAVLVRRGKFQQAMILDGGRREDSQGESGPGWYGEGHRELLLSTLNYAPVLIFIHSRTTLAVSDKWRNIRLGGRHWSVPRLARLS